MPSLLNYPNFPKLPEKPEPPDLILLNPMQEDSICFSNAILALVGEVIQDPQSYHEAISSVDCTSWQTAMNHEYASLIENQTWELVHKPPNWKLVGNKWVYMIKYKPNGYVDKFKARLVAKGVTQKCGLDFIKPML